MVTSSTPRKGMVKALRWNDPDVATDPAIPKFPPPSCQNGATPNFIVYLKLPLRGGTCPEVATFSPESTARNCLWSRPQPDFPRWNAGMDGSTCRDCQRLVSLAFPASPPQLDHVHFTYKGKNVKALYFLYSIY